jgi:hypothetical protein
MIQKTGKPFSRVRESDNQSPAAGWLVLFILIYCFVSWTQIRLTAASASPDFITSLYIMAAVICFLRSGHKSNHEKFYSFSSAVFALTAITIKLSAIGIITLPLLILLLLSLNKRWLDSLVVASMVLLISLPFLFRNYISSGWILFPSRFPDLLQPDWKFDKHELLQFQHYINAYARSPVANTDAEKVSSMNFPHWLGPWWQHISRPDQAMLIALIAAIMINLIFFRNFFAKTNLKLGLTILTLFVSLIIWFVNAPDPRFASGFMLSLFYCLMIPWQSRFDFSLRNKRPGILVFAIYIFMAGILTYSAYRVVHFFDASEIIFPKGIAKTEYKTIRCGNLKIDMVSDDRDDCGATPLPCVRDSCSGFEPRGARIEDGFRKKN